MVFLEAMGIERDNTASGIMGSGAGARAGCCQERVTYTKLIQLFAVAVIVR